MGVLLFENCAGWHLLEKDATWHLVFCQEQNPNRSNAQTS
jgi:hypothetical protein